MPSLRHWLVVLALINVLAAGLFAAGMSITHAGVSMQFRSEVADLKMAGDLNETAETKLRRYDDSASERWLEWRFRLASVLLINAAAFGVIAWRFPRPPS